MQAKDQINFTTNNLLQGSFVTLNKPPPLKTSRGLKSPRRSRSGSPSSLTSKSLTNRDHLSSSLASPMSASSPRSLTDPHFPTLSSPFSSTSGTLVDPHSLSKSKIMVLSPKGSLKDSYLSPTRKSPPSRQVNRLSVEDNLR